MNTIDFLCRAQHSYKAILIGLACFVPLTAQANPPAMQSPPFQRQLILTLSDSWAEVDNPKAQNFLHKTNHTPVKQLIGNTSKTDAAKIGCGMDVSNVPTLDNSLTSRVVGKCNFNYQY